MSDKVQPMAGVSVEDRLGTWIQTFSNVAFWPLDPRPDEVRIEDIAHALSLKCRWAGMTKEFLSIAQHSWSVSYMVNEPDALWGLLHDAAEAYLVDMPRPLKLLPEFTWYRELEERVQRAVCDRFGLSRVEPEAVRHADAVMLMTEKRDLMGPEPQRFSPLHADPVGPRIEPIHVRDSKDAEQLFLTRFAELMKVRS